MQYLVKWKGYLESETTWEPPCKGVLLKEGYEYTNSAGFVLLLFACRSRLTLPLVGANSCSL